ncbi:MAG: type II/IV secretion system protein [Thermoproteus sp.]
MDVDIYAIVVITALALTVIAAMQPLYYATPSLSAIYRYWPQYYNYTISGDMAALRPIVEGLTCWIYINGTWAPLVDYSHMGVSTSVLNLTCR